MSTSMSQAISGVHIRAVSRSRLTRSQRREIWFFVFSAPFLFGLIALTIFPMGYGFYTSLTNWDGLSPLNTKFIGLQNYAQSFQDPNVLPAIKQTLLFVLLNVPAWIILSFGLALLLNRDLKGSGLLRTLFYLPTILPAVAVVMIWKIILDQNSGLLNGLLSLFRPGTAIPWLGQYALQGLVCTMVWGGLGWGMVVFLAGLQGIPAELIESAKIDGANSWHVFRNITLPLMSPVLFFQLVMALIGSFQQLVYPLLMATPLGLGGETSVIGFTIPNGIRFFMVYTYERIRQSTYGYALALLWLLFVAIIILAALLFWSEKFWVYKGDVEEQRA
jgi:multiple sugar transport system permease protein